MLLLPLPSQCVFDDLSGSVSLSWVGDSTGVSTVGLPSQSGSGSLWGGQQRPPPVPKGLQGRWDLKQWLGWSGGDRRRGHPRSLGGGHGGSLSSGVTLPVPLFPPQVILVLTTFQVPLVIMSFGQSKLYRR